MRRGQQPTDPYVARLSYAWATQVLRTDRPRASVRERLAEVGLGGTLLALLGAVTDPAVVGASLGGTLSLREWRLARRITALGPTPVPEPVDGGPST